MKSFLLSALLLSTSFAADLTIKAGLLESNLTVEGTFLATDVTVFQIDAKQWTTFVVSDLLEHGATVTKDTPILTFKEEDYHKKLLEAEDAATSRQLALAKAERQLADLKASTPHALEGLKLTHDRAKEALDDFTQTSRALSEEEAKESLGRAERQLSYQEEELKQLLKMYEEDGITEETEEIILKRQRSSVKSAKFALKRAQKSSSWALAKTIPRKAVDLQRSFDEALLAYETGKITLPSTLEEKTLELKKLKREHADKDQKFTELKDDAKDFTFLAPSDGTIYYGEISKHSWSPGNTAKFLKKNATVPTQTALITFVPADSPLSLQGSLGQADRLNLPAQASGEASIAGLKNTTFPTTVAQLGNAPDAKNQFPISMSVELPADSPIVTGMKAKVTLSTFKKENVISLPNSAITTKDGISTVKLKMADGQNELRPVTLGHNTGKKTEIISGLEIGQVIIIPDKAAPKKKTSDAAAQKSTKSGVETKPEESSQTGPTEPAPEPRQPEPDPKPEPEPEPEPEPAGDPVE